jgi:membrane-associated phospholipid phosphatase
LDQAGRALTAAGAVLLLAFAAWTAVIARGLPLGPDLAAERAVQAVAWGPLLPVFALVDYVDGLRQVALAAVVIAAAFVLNRRAAVWALACALSAAMFEVLELAVHRPRPPSALVHVLRHATGFSYPSGHAVFYTWALAVLVVGVIAVRWRRWTWPAAVLAALALAVVLLGRVYEGEHWPSDCLGGVLLGAGWTSLTLGLPRIGRPVLAALRGEAAARRQP